MHRRAISFAVECSTRMMHGDGSVAKLQSTEKNAG